MIPVIIIMIASALIVGVPLWVLYQRHRNPDWIVTPEGSDD